MGTPGHDCIVRSSGQACDVWHLEWSYINGTGTPLLSTAVGEGLAWTDFDPRIKESVGTLAAGDGFEDLGVGITAFRFPASRRVRTAFVEFEPASKAAAANFLRPVVTDLVAVAGTGKVILLAANGGAIADPAAGDKIRVTLHLEYR